MNKLSVAIVLGLTSVASAVTDLAPGGVPALPAEGRVWPGVTLIIVAGLFICAATIGPLVAILMPTAVEPESHDEHELDEHGDHGHGGHGHGHGH